jgi:hypothetical protein
MDNDVGVGFSQRVVEFANFTAIRRVKATCWIFFSHMNHDVGDAPHLWHEPCIKRDIAALGRQE